MLTFREHIVFTVSDFSATLSSSPVVDVRLANYGVNAVEKKLQNNTKPCYKSVQLNALNHVTMTCEALLKYKESLKMLNILHGREFKA